LNFGLVELKNIYKNCPEHMTPEKVQSSIKHFSWGLINNPERYQTMNNPIGVLVSTLINGVEWVEQRYISDDQIKSSKIKSQNIELIELKAATELKQWPPFSFG